MRPRHPTKLLAVFGAAIVVAVLGIAVGGPDHGGASPSNGVSQRHWERSHDLALDGLTTPVGSHNLLGREEVIGRSARGRRIAVRQFGDPALPAVLVFGCIHGTECAARTIEPVGGCPPTDADIYKVPNLNRDGFEVGTRLNARGVDLNRNFPAGWKPIGSHGSPQYSGPKPFSEPETRIAAHLIRWLRPRVTIWFHQQPGPAMVRAWGGSVPLAHRYGRLAGIPFRRLPWLAGTAPNWQNHRFPGTASFVVELPPGELSAAMSRANNRAIVDLARRIASQG